jgi:hypothetical protein
MKRSRNTICFTGNPIKDCILLSHVENADINLHMNDIDQMTHDILHVPDLGDMKFAICNGDVIVERFCDPTHRFYRYNHERKDGRYVLTNPDRLESENIHRAFQSIMHFKAMKIGIDVPHNVDLWYQNILLDVSIRITSDFADENDRPDILAEYKIAYRKTADKYSGIINSILD